MAAVFPHSSEVYDRIPCTPTHALSVFKSASFQVNQPREPPRAGGAPPRSIGCRQPTNHEKADSFQQISRVSVTSFRLSLLNPGFVRLHQESTAPCTPALGTSTLR